nr:MAG: RNA-dependent RNA polymerase [Crogonang virus 35]
MIKEKLGKRGKHKYRRRTNDKVMYIKDHPIASLNYDLYRELLSISGKSYLIEKFNLDHAMQDYELIKSLVNWSFINGVDDYEYIVGMDTLFGWEYNPDLRLIPKKLEDWVSNDFRPLWEGDEDKFNDKFRSAVRKVLRWKRDKQAMDVTAADFCINIASTGTAGSAYDPGGPRLKVDVDGNTEKVNNKYAKSAKLSLKNKLSRLFSMERQKANVSIKVEFMPKVRLIVSSDYNTSLKMRFVDVWLKKWMSGNKLSTLFQSTHDTMRMWISMCTNEGWNVPVDQSQFDHRVTKNMVRIMIEEIKTLIADFATNNDELLRVMDSIMYALDGGEIIWAEPNADKVKFEYKSGVLSGWQWTAFFDTLANISEALMAVEMCKLKGIHIKNTLFNAQGDDQLVRFETLKECVAYVCALRSFGFIIHPAKTFYSKKHNEYLRKYAKEGMLNGYPARMINSMMWVYPGDRVEHKIMEKLSSTTSNWIKLSERLKVDKKVLLPYLQQDLKNAKVPHALIDKYLTTEVVFGGGGFGPVSNYTFNEVPKEKATVQIDGVGYDEFRLRFGKYQTREMEDWMIKAIAVDDSVGSETDVIDVEPMPILQPLQFMIKPGIRLPQPARRDKFPTNVIFGSSRKFMDYVFPQLDTFTDMLHAPKSWVFDYITGKIKMPSLYSNRLSSEFSSMVWSMYSESIVSAMYYKKTVPNKWDRLVVYAQKEFWKIVDATIPHGMRMF